MAFELPDFWTTAGIGLALLSLVPGMASVPSASHIEFKVSRFCALAAATLFLFKLALWGSESLTVTRLALVAVFGALIAMAVAYALHWINKKEEATTPVSVPVAAVAETHEQSVPVRRGPTLEATNGSKIDATGAVIPGDLPFQFGKADGGSIIDMPVTVVTRQGDGSIIIEPGKIPVNRTFPPPTGEFSDLSNDDLKARALTLAAALRDFQNRFEVENRSLPRLSPPEFGVPKDIFAAFSEKYRSEYDAKFVNQATSIASEIMARIENAAPGTRIQHNGARTLYLKSFAGPRASLEVAEFLELLAHSESKPN